MWTMLGFHKKICIGYMFYRICDFFTIESLDTQIMNATTNTSQILNVDFLGRSVMKKRMLPQKEST